MYSKQSLSAAGQQPQTYCNILKPLGVLVLVDSRAGRHMKGGSVEMGQQPGDASNNDHEQYDTMTGGLVGRASG